MCPKILQFYNDAIVTYAITSNVFYSKLEPALQNDPNFTSGEVNLSDYLYLLNPCEYKLLAVTRVDAQNNEQKLLYYSMFIVISKTVVKEQPIYTFATKETYYQSPPIIDKIDHELPNYSQN